MDTNHTKKSTRIIIWIIAIVMAFGFLGSYFLLIIQNEQASKPHTSTADQTKEELPVDPTAFKINGKVDTLQKTDLKEGDGDEVKAGDTVTVHYKGTIAQTGVKFDSSYDRGEPIDISLASVIAGWQEGVPGMKVGGMRRLVIPAAMAYGDQAQSGIPANSDLVFEVEVLAIKPAEATAQ